MDNYVVFHDVEMVSVDQDKVEVEVVNLKENLVLKQNVYVNINSSK